MHSTVYDVFQIEDVLLLDVTSQSLGIETVGGQMTVLIHRNSTIPMNVKKNFTTFIDYQDNVNVQVNAMFCHEALSQGSQIITKFL